MLRAGTPLNCLQELPFLSRSSSQFYSLIDGLNPLAERGAPKALVAAFPERKDTALYDIDALRGDLAITAS